MGLIPDEVRAVYFDAVGTLIFPDPPVARAYLETGLRYGSRLTRLMETEVKDRFRAAFARQEKLDKRMGYRTSEEREEQRWRAIVADVLPDASQPEDCFNDLYEHFLDGANWNVHFEAQNTLSRLRRRGLKIGLASNFDGRLHLVLDRHESLRSHLDRVIVSSEIGWRKPAPQFFAALCDGYAPNQVLLVGDDRVNDYDGARAAGLHAVLLDDKTTLNDLL
ncbi:MAG: HAD-IA family hydrolase [Gemmataceae bacterium]